MSNYTREELCEIVHKILDQLPKYDKRSSEYGKKVPKNGIYFWYEKGETRNGDGLRVVRIGINKKQDRLYGRINEHYSSSSKREGSSFRKDLGAALMFRNRESDIEIMEWRRKRKDNPRFNDQMFNCYENLVNQEIKRFSYCVLKVDDLCERSVLEIQLISLFSNCSHCLPTCTWFGKYSDKQEIRDSGLWNKDYVFCTYKFTECGLDRLKELVDETLKSHGT